MFDGRDEQGHSRTDECVVDRYDVALSTVSKTAKLYAWEDNRWGGFLLLDLRV